MFLVCARLDVYVFSLGMTLTKMFLVCTRLDVCVFSLDKTWQKCFQLGETIVKCGMSKAVTITSL